VYDRRSARYFTFTGNVGLGSPDTILSGPEAQAALDRLAELLEQLAAPTTKKKGDGAATGHQDELELEGAPKGQRRTKLSSEAGRLRALGVSRAEAKPVLMDIAAKCTPPVPDEDVDELLAWAWTKPARQPHCPVCHEPEPCPKHLSVPPTNAPPPGHGQPPS